LKEDLFKEDAESLFLVDRMTIGERTVYIRPFTINDLPLIVRCFNDARAELAEQEITWDNFYEPERIHMFAAVISKHAPEIIRAATGIDPKHLSLIQAYVLATRIVRLNIQSAEGLEKNLLGSAQELADMIESVSAKWLSSSSATATDGKK